MKRFVILGLPRSGSTYFMTLLNAHRDVFCSGEQYNPFAVVGIDDQDDSHETVLGRDKDPIGHMDAFFEQAERRDVAWAGFKFMIGHNIHVLKELEKRPDITILYVWRENRLAQVSSLIKALHSRTWAQTKVNDHIDAKIHTSPRNISQYGHEFETSDYLISMWLERLSNPKRTFEYRDLFKPGFEKEICQFLDLPYTRRMKSPLVKQGSNAIVDRFKEPKPFIYYYNQLGLGRWLDEEL